MKTSEETITKKQKSATKKMDPVVHFEIPAKDRNRIAKFYNEAFGWQTQMLGEDMGYYGLVTTTEVDKAGMPLKKATINGGFYEIGRDVPIEYPSVVIAVDDLNESMKKITKAGGKVLGEPAEIKGFGLYVSFYDSEGNRNSIIEPLPEMKKEKEKTNRKIS